MTIAHNPADNAADNPVASRWPLQRVLFLMAGSVTLLGVVLTVAVSRWFLLVPTFVGLNQLLFAAAGWCPASLLLRRLGVPDLRDAPASRTPVGSR